ncbi:MAG: hypothetical protein ACOYJA_05495 [Christensenellales bacterium]
MRCAKCGEQCPPGEVYCPNCGAALLRPSRRRRRFSKKRLIRAAVLLLLCVGLIVGAIVGVVKLIQGLSGGGGSLKDTYPLVYLKDNEVFLKDGEADKRNISPQLSQAVADIWKSDAKQLSALSRDGTALYYLDGYDPDLRQGVLYVKQRDAERAKIADGAFEYFVVSQDGGRVLYLTGYDSATQTGELYLYTRKDGSSRKLAASVVPGFYCFSPNGERVAYAKQTSLEQHEADIYLDAGGEQPELIDERAYMPLMVTDKGAVYYAKNPELENKQTFSLYLKDGRKDTERLANDVRYIWTNPTGGELLFLANYTGQVGDLYYQKAGQDREKVDGNVTDLLFGQGTVLTRANRLIPVGVADRESLSEAIAYWKKDASGVTLAARYKGGEVLEVVQAASTPVCLASRDLTRFFFVKEGVLSARGYDRKSAALTEEMVLTQAVVSVGVSQDGKTVYALKGEAASSALVRIGEDGQEQTLAEGVHAFQVSASGKSVLYLANFDSAARSGELYLNTQGQPQTRIASSVAEYIVQQDPSNGEMKRIYLLSDYDTAKQVGLLYLYDGGELPVKLDSDVQKVLRY